MLAAVGVALAEISSEVNVGPVISGALADGRARAAVRRRCGGAAGVTSPA
jgi:hypothetical protein